MQMPRVIIADTDMGFVNPLKLKFAQSFFGKINLEIITDKVYFERLFERPQKVDVLIVSDSMYSQQLVRHDIENLFVMVEDYREGETENLAANRLYKYTNVKDIFNEIVAKSSAQLHVEGIEKKDTQIVLVTSAYGGAGKTTVAMGLSLGLAKDYKRVLYINAGHLQMFQHMLNDPSPIMEQELYAKMLNPKDDIYNELRHVIRHEQFYYLPPFKAALLSLGMNYSIFEKVALSAKKSGDYDYIIIDTENSFDENLLNLINVADYVMIVTEQKRDSVYKTNILINHIDGVNAEKYLFVCNKFNKDEFNALSAPDVSTKYIVSEFIDDYSAQDYIKAENLTDIQGMRKLAYLVI